MTKDMVEDHQIRKGPNVKPDVLSERIEHACRLSGYRDAVIHQSGRTARLVRIPGFDASRADELKAFVTKRLAATGFAVDYYAHSVPNECDGFIGAMIYGRFPDGVLEPKPYRSAHRLPVTPAPRA